jgi:alcohol dehydrogenase class IV
MSLPSINWNYPTNILFGDERIKELPALCRQMNISNPLIVTDSGLAQFEFIKTIVADLQHSLGNVDIFSDVKANPNGENIEQGVAHYKKGQHDGVIAIGGGSGLDAAKAIALMVGQVRPIWDFEDIGNNYQRVNADAMAPVIAVPTTAGTGSEVGRASVIVDESVHLKKIIFHPNMLPASVILDPQLTVDLPPAVTAATGIDAFVHNFEAYCSPGYHPMADGIALEGMRLIKEWLPIAYRSPTNLTARGHMLSASTMGATAFQKGLGAVHALAHPLGAIYDKHHGLLNAILLPYVIRANHCVIENQILNLCAVLNIKSDFESFFQWILKFRQDLGIPNTLADIGIEANSDKATAQEIGKLALADPSASGNPINLCAGDYQKIFERAVIGDLS